MTGKTPKPPAGTPKAPGRRAFLGRAALGGTALASSTLAAPYVNAQNGPIRWRLQTYSGAPLGAHVIKIKLSTDHLELGEAKKVYEAQSIDVASLAARVAHCMQAAFGGRRIVVFSGGAQKGENDVYDDARAIRDGGGNGSIIGRNTFQRSRDDALAMLQSLVDIYKGKN